MGKEQQEQSLNTIQRYVAGTKVVSGTYRSQVVSGTYRSHVAHTDRESREKK